MDEATWLACADPQPMLEFLRGKASDRKLRLFAVACCRHIWEFMPDEQGRNAVEVAERLAEGMATNAERRAAALAAGEITLGRGGAASCAASAPAFHAADRASANAAHIFGSTTEPYKRSGAYNPACQAAFNQAFDKERTAQAPLVREIFGNPFRPVAIESAWRVWNGGIVVNLGQVIYDERQLPSGHLDAGRLPTLVGALEAAGCADAELLGHLRGAGPHVRGCHVLDALLGKE